MERSRARRPADAAPSARAAPSAADRAAAPCPRNMRPGAACRPVGDESSMTQPLANRCQSGRATPPTNLICDAAASILVRACFQQQSGAIRASNQRPRRDGAKSHFACLVGPGVKLLRRHEAVDRQEPLARSAGGEVLAERQHVDVRVAQLPHRVGDFGVRFAEADHDAALGQQIGPQSLRVAAARRRLCANDARGSRTMLIEPRHAFDVVREHGQRNAVEQMLQAPLRRPPDRSTAVRSSRAAADRCTASTQRL